MDEGADEINPEGTPVPPRHKSQQFRSPTSGHYHSVLRRLLVENNFNPVDLNPWHKKARCFVLKTDNEFDIYSSLKHSVWSSTVRGNEILNKAFMYQGPEEEEKRPIYLFFSVSGSSHFCGAAQMMSPVDYNATLPVWSRNTWSGQFKVKWMYVKDVPNRYLEHIRLANNENKPVTWSRDVQELLPDAADKMIGTMHEYRHRTSILDDFQWYEEGNGKK